jgi:membrane fusion protein, multidrug efflux system
MPVRTRIVSLVFALLLVAAAVSCQSSSGNAPKGGGPGGRDAANMAIPVAVAQINTRDFPIYLRGLGTVTPYNMVTVKTRVDGEIVKVNFREGQDVKQGELLAQIDPRPFEVQLHQAQGTEARDEAQLNDAKVNLARFQALYQEKVIAKQQVDTQAALVGQVAGAIQSDKAQVENARLQLTYSRVTAPISGRIGLRAVDPGNIVHAADPNGLAVITQIQPIAVIFTLPEDVLQQVLRQFRTGSLQADAYSRDDTTKIAAGKLLTINNLIDPTTGTDRLKAVFDNADRQLWPNQFVNIHLLVDVKKNAVVAPVAAIQHSNQGTFAYVVKPDKTVDVRQVKVGATEGNLVAVDSGLQAGDVVVTDGQDKLQANSKVEIRQGGGTGPNGGQRGQNAAQGNTQQGQPGTMPQGAPGSSQASPAANQGLGQANAPATPGPGAAGPDQGRSGRRR